MNFILYVLSSKKRSAFSLLLSTNTRTVGLVNPLSSSTAPLRYSACRSTRHSSRKGCKQSQKRRHRTGSRQKRTQHSPWNNWMRKFWFLCRLSLIFSVWLMMVLEVPKAIKFYPCWLKPFISAFYSFFEHAFPSDIQLAQNTFLPMSELNYQRYGSSPRHR